jgi:hemerythrin-like domain-containing protein
MSPTDTLREDHERILTALSVLSAIAAKPGPLPREHVDQLVAFFRGFTDRCHHAKEENALFPALEARGIPRHGGPIGMMLHEHEEGRALLRDIEEGAAAGDAAGRARFAQAVREYEDLLDGHIHKENDVLFRMAERVLDDAERVRLAATFARYDADELGPGERERLLASVAALARVYL